MSSPYITPIENAETRARLAQARADFDAGRITRAEYQAIWNECYHAYLETLAERRAELGYLHSTYGTA